MRTAFLFPGLHSALRRRDRERYAELPSVQARLAQLREGGFAGQWQEDCATLADAGAYGAVAAITCAYQCGIAHHLMSAGMQPDVMVGCSLGDLARNVCTGALPFAEVVRLCRHFDDNAVNFPHHLGQTCSVRAPAGRVIDRDFERDCELMGLAISVMSRRHAIISGTELALRVVEDACRRRGWACEGPHVPFPVHSPLIEPTLNDLALDQWASSGRDPDRPVYSAVQLRFLNTCEDLLADMRHCYTRPVRWTQAMTQLQREHGVERFINIGPCQSLALLSRDSQDMPRVEKAPARLLRAA
ncbi:acyltransferase domain-containing protein [Mangrovimicrobium sediminis]|uniref:[acyl-carrier-protein] S-malonyltransferase n=1 Tax=Mangrovimicrobium sediminis TaxID=2562682 RepID=A0A4Z0M1W2_9GAMM|nr:acyltransferase domain-containing protein [Haliea sp. SAOS-164]TGD73531.1 acyltransferase domain-containing protein [Haliea sp. SAOS-164]